ncbi:hypothetical protein NHX12_003988 [Muraenolepis orangiensis]|uniref:Uncharacterized protein n=1 Tax=Muraenolepis orangiensis TaxID=630683 RepID=A0A9Q0DUE1_9TELE|nr:hypothetical protein NHX12_003988 [Muraenolepis orangiensis]
MSSRRVANVPSRQRVSKPLPPEALDSLLGCCDRQKTESIPFELDFTPGRSNTGTDLSRASGGRGLETLCLDGTLATLRLDIQGTSSSPTTGCVMKRGESVAFITRGTPQGEERPAALPW